jgi:hypothetical protein
MRLLALRLPTLAIERQVIESLVDLEGDGEVQRVASTGDQAQGRRRRRRRLHRAVAAAAVFVRRWVTTTNRCFSTVTSSASSVCSPISSSVPRQAGSTARRPVGGAAASGHGRGQPLRASRRPAGSARAAAPTSRRRPCGAAGRGVIACGAMATYSVIRNQAGEARHPRRPCFLGPVDPDTR